MALGATLTRTLQAVITADASRFVSATGQASRSADTLAAKLRRGIGKAAPYAAIGLGLVAFQAKQGVAGVMEDEKALTNLESTLKATGNAANITADGFFKYANKLQAATGVGADQITQGAALLGTFKAVRNEVGKGNQIFTRATEAALDLSKKGFGDLNSANKMLGKALQDPTRGITALSRAGVTFSDQQKEQIKTMQESGDLLGAQKLILAEVEGQVKGTAKAYGETTAGQVDRAARAFEELQKALAVALLPIITTLAGLLTKVSGFMQKNEKVVKVAIVAFTGLAVAILAVNAALKVIGAISALSNPIVAVAVAIGAITVGVIALYNKSATFRKIVTGAWEAIQKAVEVVVDIFDGPVKAAFRTVSGVVEALAGLLTGDFSKAWDGMKKAVGGVLDWLKETVLALPATILTAAVGIGSAIVRGVANGVGTIGAKVWDVIKGLPAFLLGKASAWLTGLSNIGGRVIAYIAAGVSGLAAAAWEKVRNMPVALLTLAGGWLTGLAGIGGKVVDWVASGVSGLAAAVWGKISGFASALRSLVTSGASGALRGIGGAIVDWIGAGVKAGANGIVDAAKGVINLAFRAVNKAIDGANKIISGINKIPLVPDIPSIPKIPLLARGGIVTDPTTAIVGERGAEAVIPLTGSRGRNYLRDVMASIEQDRPMGGGGKNVVINLTFTGVLDAREAARRIQPELDRIVSLV